MAKSSKTAKAKQGAQINKKGSPKKSPSARRK